MNIVQIGGDAVNKSVTSRGQLLAAARELACGQGLGHVNIRAVAAQCGVAVGSIYNYFPTKADLVAAVVEDFWHTAAHREGRAPLEGEPFPAYVERLYAGLHRDLSAFQAGFLAQMSALDAGERQKGRELEARCFDHIKAGLTSALKRGGVPSRFRGREAELCDFVFRSMLSLLRDGEPGCALLREILEVLLAP